MNVRAALACHFTGSEATGAVSAEYYTGGARINFQFTLVENGRAALDVVHEQPFDVLIVDIYLPIMDGAALIRELKNDPKYKHIPVLAISAGGASAKNDALKAGADLYLDKPMRLNEVMATRSKSSGNAAHFPKSATS